MKACACAVLVTLALAAPVPAHAATVSGTVVDAEGNPLRGATVRWQGHADDASVTTTDELGTFELFMNGEPDYQSMYFIGVAKKGYWNLAGGVESDNDYVIPLEPVDDFDNPSYLWVPPQAQSEHSPFADGLGCGQCHADYHDAWSASRHAQAATDPYVLDLYTGTGAHGAVAQQGPGYRTDHPDEAGPCANCHAPTAALDAPNETRLDQVSGVHLNGVFCESCHKVRDVGDVSATPVTGAFRYRRPQNGVLMAFGPLDDAADEHHMGPMSYVPEMKQARFCAGCHQWTSDAGVVVMDTYGEWAASRYAELGIQCQDCHMRPLDHTQPATPLQPWPAGFAPGDPYCILRSPHDGSGGHDHGGNASDESGMCAPMGSVLRDQRQHHPHTFKGSTDEYLIAAASLEVSATRQGEVVEVSVSVENVNAGHMLPTGMPFRNLVLTVEARDGDGKALAQRRGPVLPDWVDAPNAAAPRAGSAGRAYARLLSDATGSLDVPFWNATQVVLDDRIPPAGKDVSVYRFRAPESGEASVRVELHYRPFLAALAAAKGWTLEDKLMAVKTVETSADGCASTPTSFPVALLALWLLARRRPRSALLVPLILVATLSGTAAGCQDAMGPMPQSGVERYERALLEVGALCHTDAGCTTGRCTEGCDGEWRCTAASCTTHTDCALGGAGATSCCVDGACVLAPGDTCGDASADKGESCATGGASDCAAGLGCARACTPQATCAAPCNTADDCSAEVHPESGRRVEYCAQGEAGGGYCLEDPEVVHYCENDVDCANGVCAFTASRAGDAMLTLCVEPSGAKSMGQTCLDQQGQPADAACEVGWCWYGGALPNTCAAVCRFDAGDLLAGDADCTCPAGSSGCTNQICLPYPFAMVAAGVAPVCYPSTRCLKDTDCGAELYCASEDLVVDVQTICMPKVRPGDTADVECTYGPTYCCDDNRCATRKAHGDACTSDAECLDRCIDGRCTGPCDLVEDCVAPFTRCAATDLPYGDGASTKPIKMCRL